MKILVITVLVRQVIVIIKIIIKNPITTLTYVNLLLDEKIFKILFPWNDKGYYGSLSMTRKEKSALGKFIYLKILKMGNDKKHIS